MFFLLQKQNLMIRSLLRSFFMKGFAEPFRLDRNRNGGGVMIYIRDDIPSRHLLNHVFLSDIEGLYLELNFRKYKWQL